jgi:hypothetical protein
MRNEAFAMKTNRLRALSIKLLLVVAAWSFLLAHVSVAHGQVESTNPGSTIKRRLPERVERFCRDVENFPSSGDTHQRQAKQFATKLCESIKTNKRLPRVTKNTLSPEAAKKLADYFHEDIAAALAHQKVIAPADILKTFMQSVRGEHAWRRLPLVTKHSLIGKPLTDVPEVIVTIADREKLTSALAASTAKAKTIAELKQAYKDAYRGHRGWFKAIAPYFDEDDEEETE